MITLISSKKVGGYKIMRDTVNVADCLIYFNDDFLISLKGIALKAQNKVNDGSITFILAIK